VTQIGQRHNNGMHPTADTTALMFIESLGAAGDAGRYALRLTNLVLEVGRCGWCGLLAE
jgi:hypothetical protein